MVRKNGYCHWLVPILHFLIDRTYRTLVKVLNRLEFQFKVTIMTSLITCLNVQIDKIICLECLNSSCCLTLIVGVVKSCSSFYVDATKSCIMTYSTNEVNGCDYRTLLYLWECLLQRGHVWTITSCPRPDAVCRVFALSNPLCVERMLAEKFLRLNDKRIDKLSRLSCRELCRLCTIGKCLCLCLCIWLHEFWSPRMERNIVRRSTLDVLVSSVDYEEVTILNTCVEVDDVAILSHNLRVICKFILKILDEDVTLLCLKSSTRVVLD